MPSILLPSGSPKIDSLDEIEFRKFDYLTLKPELHKFRNNPVAFG